MLLNCEGSFARAWTGLLGIGGLCVWWQGKGKRKGGLWIVGVTEITDEREELRD